MASKRRTAKRDSKGRFLKRSSARRVSRPRRAAKRTRRAVAVLINPRKRRTYRRNPVRVARRYRRNPGVRSIFSADSMSKVGYAALGIWGVPVVAGAINYVLPATINSMISTNPIMKIALKGASAFGLYWVADKFISKKAGEFVLVGGLAYLALSVVNEFAPAAMNPFGMGRYIGGAGKQPLLAGAAGAGRYLAPGMRGPITANTSARLSPASRF